MAEPDTPLIAGYRTESGKTLPAHVRALISATGAALAELRGGRFVDDVRLSAPAKNAYFLPDDTLLAQEASSLGIRASTDLFGGVVPFPFVRTKVITHSTMEDPAERPVGWSCRFADLVRDVVLPGYAAFDPRDACRAAAQLLRIGRVRVKPPAEASGRGQVIVQTEADCQAAVAKYDRDELRRNGLILETNLERVQTLNIGQVTVGEFTTSYFGVQRVAIDGQGAADYRGSDLVCVRGGWEALGRLALPDSIRLGVNQARCYDQAVDVYPGFLASRRNYDVGQGIDAQMRWRSGVLEASWRVGAASTAELAALNLFKQEPDLHVVHASAVKECDADALVPRDAVVHFRGHDTDGLPILRYTAVIRKEYAKMDQGLGRTC